MTTVVNYTRSESITTGAQIPVKLGRDPAAQFQQGPPT